MIKFVLSAVLLIPISLFAGLNFLSSAVTFYSKCFFNLSLYCGTVDAGLMVLFGAVAAGSVAIMGNLWGKIK